MKVLDVVILIRAEAEAEAEAAEFTPPSSTHQPFSKNP